MNKPKLSILIPTHNRPLLFKRCLESALHKLPNDIEIIVNNDTNDIEEIFHPQVTYHYQSFEHLSQVYEFLLHQSKGEFIYYLEDDDYLTHGFYDYVYTYMNYDLIGGNYFPSWNTDLILKCGTSMSREFNIDYSIFQLGQFIMKRDLAISFDFPKDSNIHNDRKLVEHVMSNTNKCLNAPLIFYVQTTDGGDNISFPESSNYLG